MKKSIYRILLIIVGLLHALAFFFIPFAKLEGIAGGLGDLAGMLGAGEAYPKKLTGMALLKSSSIIGISDEEAGILLVLVLLPVVLGALCTCLQFFGRGKASYLTALLCSLLFFGCYGFQYLIYQELEQAFYTISIAGFALVFLASGVQFLVSIVGMVKDGKTVAEKRANPKGDNIRVPVYKKKMPRKDGKLIGISGSYKGMVIPLAFHESVILGRDPAVSNLVFKDPKISKKHCKITRQSWGYRVESYSDNGTFLKNGARITKDGARLNTGDEIALGENKQEKFRFG